MTPDLTLSRYQCTQNLFRTKHMYKRNKLSGLLYAAQLMADKPLSGEVKEDEQPAASNKILKAEHLSEEEKLKLAENF